MAAASAEVAQLAARPGASSRPNCRPRAKTPQREINAVAARVGELQAQANRLNALGERLTRDGKLSDGEFNFGKAPGMGGAEAAQDMPAGDLLKGLDELQTEVRPAPASQLSVLESMLLRPAAAAEPRSRRAARPTATSLPASAPRSDPFTGGRAHHLGIDFNARTGDPVLAAAGGVVSFAGVKSGYGNVVEVDHGNGYSTLYGHNSRLIVRAGDIVRAGPAARQGRLDRPFHRPARAFRSPRQRPPGQSAPVPGQGRQLS